MLWNEFKDTDIPYQATIQNCVEEILSEHLDWLEH